MKRTKLEKFLINRGAYERFVRNLIKRTDPCTSAELYFKEHHNNPTAILNGFTWSSTPEGSTYWGSLSEEWSWIYDNENEF